MQLAVSAVGRDRPGMVAAITGVLVAHGANIADAQMTVLSGRFTMVVIADGHADLDEGSLLADLLEIGRDLGMDVVSANRIDPIAGAGAQEPTHVVTLSGIDHLGIIHAVAHQLARQRVSITDLQTRRLDDDGTPLNATMLEILPPAGSDIAALEAGLLAIAGERGLQLSLRAIPAE